MTVFRALERPVRVFLCVVLPVVAVLAFAVAPASAEFGVEKFVVAATNANGSADVQAGSHPFALTTSFVLNQPTEPRKVLEGDPRNITLKLPPGLVGDAAATARCSDQLFTGPERLEARCPNDTAVGLATAYLIEEEGLVAAFTTPVYNLVPPKGVVAEFGFLVAKRAPVLLLESVRTGGDYGVTSSSPYASQAAAIVGAKVTIWGVPAEASHDPWRGECEFEAAGQQSLLEAPGLGLRESEIEREGPDYLGTFSELGLPESSRDCASEEASRALPLLTNPTSCEAPREADLEVDSWEEPGVLRGKTTSMPELAGCERLAPGFKPTIKAEPTSTSGASPAGLNVNIEVPQEGTESPTGLADAAVKDTSVTLPAGMQMNPSAADGLQACSISEIGFERFEELPSVPGVETAIFTPGAPSCPDASKLADVHIKSPDLEGELEGAVYLASPQNFAGLPENPFSSLIALYLVAEEPKAGILVKLAGKVIPNPETGQLTTTFEDTPQLPFSQFRLEFFSGERAPLSTPVQCGTYTTEATFTPWSGTPPVTSASSFAITSGPAGRPCASPQPFTPSLTAGTNDINAGAFSPLTTTVDREDQDQVLGSVQVRLPAGLAGVLTGVPQCSEADANAGSCPAASLIGETTASVGVGNDPFTVTGGKVYLTGPYHGAPFGLSIVTPAVAGPFNLGNVIVRATIEIDPHTAQVTVTTGKIPYILDGIPLQIKHVTVAITRPGFTFNPTSCEPMSVTGTIESKEGTSALVSSPFEVADCAALKYTPTVAISTGAHVTKANGASLTFKIAYPKGAMGTQAWFKEVKFDIPKQLPVRQPTLGQACLLATFQTNRAACPKYSKIGTAIVHTPVLPVPLEGPVYFVSYGNTKFPNVVMVISGDNVNIELVGETLIRKGVTSATFVNLPDVPFENVEVTLPTGPYSEFTSYVNAKHPYDVCAAKMKVPTLLKAQNGLQIKQETPIHATNCPKTKTKKHATHKKAKHNNKK
jgi:hypothetical protein